MQAYTYPGNIYIIAAPSGTGKTTLYRRLLKEDDRLNFSVSHTTRAPRAGEKDGHDYHFVDRPSFEELIDANAFLEWAEVHGRLYGTAKSTMEAMLMDDRDVLLDIDVAGAQQVQAVLPSVCSIFILPPDHASLHQRLTKRGNTQPDDIAQRLTNACAEVRHVLEFDYVLVNDDLDTCYQELKTIIAANRLRTFRRRALVARILETFPEKA